MLVLEADRAVAVDADPLREEDDAMDAALGWQDVDGDTSAGGFGPGQFVTALVELHEIDLLAFDPAASDMSGVDAVVNGGVVFDIDLVLPTVGVGIDEAVSDDA
jgi:hypothetical protein